VLIFESDAEDLL